MGTSNEALTSFLMSGIVEAESINKKSIQKVLLKASHGISKRCRSNEIQKWQHWEALEKLFWKCFRFVLSERKKARMQNFLEFRAKLDDNQEEFLNA